MLTGLIITRKLKKVIYIVQECNKCIVPVKDAAGITILNCPAGNPVNDCTKELAVEVIAAAPILDQACAIAGSPVAAV